MEFHKLAIKELKRETPNAISILFDVPDHLKDAYSFIAGQYVTLQTEIDGESVRRDYSICSTPESGQLKVVVKKVADGFFSKYAFERLKPEDVLEVALPQGRFTFDPQSNAPGHLFAVAAGSGITPIMSVIQQALENTAMHVTLLYGNKSKVETIFYNEIQALASKYGNRLHVKYIFSQETNKEALFGRIERSTIKFMLNQIELPKMAFICGPEPMIHVVKDVLQENEMPETAIKFELFTAPTAKESTPSKSMDGTATITILVDDEEETFTMTSGSTILEEALKHDIDAPYSCQGGICSSCIAKVTEGEVTMRQNNILTDGEIAQGLVLTCQAEPISSVVRIDYDDV